MVVSEALGIPLSHATSRGGNWSFSARCSAAPVREPHLRPGFPQEAVQDGAVALHEGDHVREALGAGDQQPRRDRTDDPHHAAQLGAQVLLLYPLCHACRVAPTI